MRNDDLFTGDIFDKLWFLAENGWQKRQLKEYANRNGEKTWIGSFVYYVHNFAVKLAAFLDRLESRS